MTQPISTTKYGPSQTSRVDNPRRRWAPSRRRSTLVRAVSAIGAIGAIGAMMIAVSVMGCVTNQLQAVEDSRRAYDDCVLEHSASHPNCKTLQRDLLDAQRQYDEQGRRAWGCRAEDDPCPYAR